jgi:hypothetical protein
MKTRPFSTACLSSFIRIGADALVLPSSAAIAQANPSLFLALLLWFVTVAAAVPASLQAQTFQHVPALSFTKVYAGGDPLSQVIGIASTGANFNFSASAVSSTGGDWLTITNSNGCCYTTPQAMTVSANPAVTLATGTYTGQITVKSQGGALTLNIPVTLTIMAMSTSFFDDVAGGLTFAMATGSTGPPSQDVQIRNAGTGTLAWTASTSTADGGAWLHLSSLGGTAPSVLAIGINPANLPGLGLTAGTFIGQIVFQTAEDSVTVPITVTVGASVFSQVNPLNFTKTFAGGDPLSQVISIASTDSAINFTATAVSSTGGDWLTITNSNGCCYTTPQAMTVSVNPGVSLAAGTYMAEIIVKSQSGTDAIVVPVTLTIEPSTATFFDDVPGALTFAMATGGTAPPSQALQIRNAGAGTLDWTASPTTADGGNWLSLSAASGTAPAYLTIGINPANLPGLGLTAGTFTGQVVLKTAGDTVTVPITVSVGTSVFGQVNPLSFTKTFAGGDPLSQVISIASTDAAINFTATAVSSTGGDWLTITNSNGCCYTTPQAMTVSANPGVSLAAGTYMAEIIVKSQGGGDVIVVPVTLTIEPSPATSFDSLPGELTFSLATGGTAPPSQDVQIRNAGAGTLAWTASATTADGGNWLSLSAPSGTAPAYLTIGINPANLPGMGLTAGVFTGQVVLQTAGNQVTIPITVSVGTSVFLQINPINFSKTYQGADPLPQVITVASTDAAINFTATAVSSTGGDWLTITNSNGCCYTTTQSITVSANPGGTLAAGTYMAEIIVKSQGGGDAIVVPVTLTIEPSTATFFDSMQGELTYSMTPGGSPPAAQTIPIRNAGTGSLNWSLTASTSDGGAWLNISASSGTAPSAPTVTVIPANLPSEGLVAGTFTGEIVLQTAGDRVTIPVAVTVGASVFSQLDPVAFTYPSGGPTAPLPKVITIASTAANINFTAAAVTSTGGNWLTISVSSGCCYTTPKAITVTANPSTTLASGNYSAEIIIKSQSSGEAMVIPVTLGVTSTPGLQFVPVLPCRVADTRNPSGPFGGPGMAAGTSREFDIPQSACNISATAVAYSLNVTVVPNAALNYLTLWPSGQPQPNASTLNSDGRVKANAAITPAGTNGGVSVFVSDASQVILDVDGYFVPAGTTSALAFYPVTPCRVADTRNPTGPLGGPFLAGGTSRAFPVQSSSCSLPANAQAYSLNITAVPHTTLNYLTTWPTGESQPYVSTLNSSTGAVTANAAIVPAGSGGNVSVFVYDDADVILDINGYFAPPATAGLSLYTTVPCRTLDTRLSSGPFNGVLLVPVHGSTCAPPLAAQAYVLNATVVPSGPLVYLTLWPDGAAQPYVSTLNADDGAVTSNMAIVPTNNGAVDAFGDGTTNLILDISSYFAP